ncbi:MAG: hypothetical protein GY942_19430 [Aestuariibacter sp.]|nr:hypothetical protein [Halieaceae bacterium]MCP5012155.1 hypothetical protein [Aestuariibacter sp.]
MAITARQATPIAVNVAATNIASHTLAAEPVAGSRLVFLLTVDKTAGAFTPPAGFAPRCTVSGGSMSLFICDKVSDASETGAISVSWSNSRPNKSQLVELQADGTIVFVGADENDTNATGQSMNTGSFLVGALAAFCLTLWGCDSAKADPSDPDPTGSWTGPIATYAEDWSASAGVGEPAYVLGMGTFAPAATATSTYTHDGVTDQQAAAIIGYAEEAPTGPGDVLVDDDDVITYELDGSITVDALLDADATGTTGATINGVAVAGWTTNVGDVAEAVQFTTGWPAAIGSFFNTDLDFVIDGSISTTIQIEPPAGYAARMLSGYNANISPDKIVEADGQPALADGKQVVWQLVDDAGNDVNITAAGDIEITPPVETPDNPPGDFYAAAVDDTDGALSAFVLQSALVVDVTPNAFALDDIPNATPGATYYRDVTVAGMDAGESASATALGDSVFAVSTDGGSSFGSPGTTPQPVENDYVVRVYLTASATLEGTASGGLDIGGVSDTYTVTTRSAIVPALSSPSASRASATSADWSVTTDQPGDLLVLISENATENQATVIANGDAWLGVSAGVVSDTESGLTTGTTIYVHFVLVGAEANSAVASSSGVLLSADADEIAPSLTVVLAADSLITTAAFTLTGTADENCDVAVVISSNSTTPTVSAFNASGLTDSATLGAEWSVTVGATAFVGACYAHVRLIDANFNSRYYSKRITASGGGGGSPSASTRARRIVATR